MLGKLAYPSFTLLGRKCQILFNASWSRFIISQYTMLCSSSTLLTRNVPVKRQAQHVEKSVNLFYCVLQLAQRAVEVRVLQSKGDSDSSSGTQTQQPPCAESTKEVSRALGFSKQSLLSWEQGLLSRVSCLYHMKYLQDWNEEMHPTREDAEDERCVYQQHNSTHKYTHLHHTLQ